MEKLLQADLGSAKARAFAYQNMLTVCFALLYAVGVLDLGHCPSKSFVTAPNVIAPLHISPARPIAQGHKSRTTLRCT